MKLHFSWERLRAIHLAAAIACAKLGYLAGPSWWGMLDAALVAYNLGVALWITFPILPMVREIERMQVAFKHMANFNDALLHDRVIHLFGEPPPEPTDEHKSRLH